MRDPARIDRILELLRTYWESAPDLRLGQLVENAHRFSLARANLFSTEDYELEIGLLRLLGTKEQ